MKQCGTWDDFLSFLRPWHNAEVNVFWKILLPEKMPVEPLRAVFGDTASGNLIALAGKDGRNWN